MSKRTLNTINSTVKRVLGYDLASNRLWNQNLVQITGQDEFYAYDGLYQVKTFQRGTLNGTNTGLTGTPVWEEDFTFDPTGNWTNYVQQVSGSTTLNQDRTHNKVNEIETIAGSSSLIAQDAAGNITKAPQPANWSSAYTMVYDAWNRLVQVKNGSTAVENYAYDGQNWRTTKTNSSSVVRHYYYTSSWQIVEERVGSSTSPERQHVWGLLGMDNLVLRDRPGSSERLYAMADALGSVTALTNPSGTVEERYGYEAYGTVRFMNASFGSISSSAYDWNVLYGSYKWDGASGYYQVRNRYLHPGLGRWLSRDPIGESGGLNLYGYVGNNPINDIDPDGLCKVEIRYKKLGHIPLGGDYYHAYIIVTDTDGRQTIYRAGPGGNGGGVSSAATGAPSGSGGGGGYGNLTGMSAPYNKNAPDWDPGTPPSQTLLDDNKPCKCDSGFQNYVDKINNSHIPYNPFSTNSNAFANGAAKAAGFSPAAPPVWAPGTGTNLPTK